MSVGLVVGFVADRLLGDPRRYHPVAGFGQLAGALQGPLYRDSKASGAAYEALLVGGTAALGALAYRGPAGLRATRGPHSGDRQQRAAGQRPSATNSAWRVAATAAATWAVLGGRTLEREARAVGDHVQRGDLPAARQRVRSLVGRDPSNLSGDDLARACVESLAENTSDAVVAPLVWGAAAGVPGLLGYRAINTLDAMVGYRSPKWANFGWAAAKVDDVANLVPARLAAGLTAVLSGRPREVLAVVRRDAAQHPSPNGGRIEAAYAATLDVRLGGSNTYDGVSEDRGVLGDGAPVRVPDIERAARLSRRLATASLAATVLARVGIRALKRR